jgi:glucokinase
LLVLGGGVIEGLPNLIAIAEISIKERALEIVMQKLKLKKSALGENAGIVGAATIAQNNL